LAISIPGNADHHDGPAGLAGHEPGSLLVSTACCRPGIPATKVSGGSGRLTMSTGDKFENKADELKGKAKQAAGRATDDPDLEAEGEVDETKGSLKQAGEKVKDAFKK
jgi:uncharacterized protein YjbJ (UPF0337 family)